MKLSTHFTVQELVHQDIIDKVGEQRAANFISSKLLSQLEKLRREFGPIIINNNRYSNSGLRKASYYKNRLGMMRESYSTHQYGNTADLKFTDTTPIEVFDCIIKNPNKYPFIVRMENAYKTKTWLHIECGKYKEDKIEVFDP